LPALKSRRSRCKVVKVRAEAYVSSADEKPPVLQHMSPEDRALALRLLQKRRERRRVFSFLDWRRHRSQSRYIHHIQTIKESGVVRSIARPVMIVAALSAVVAMYNYLFIVKPPWLPAWLPTPLTVAMEPIQLTTIALSLLLVFRTNASYARWEEARKSFGAITTVSRDIARQVLSWFPNSNEGREGKDTACRWLIALAKSSMVHLRDEHDLRQEVGSVLLEEELARLEASGNRPMYCIQVLSQIFATSGLPYNLVVCLDENLTRLVNAVYACERILGTPIPLSYTRHTARFLMAWLFCIPFTLWPYSGWAMVPLAALISFVLLGIEEIGIFLEEPFSVLALEHLCGSCADCIQSMSKSDKEISERLGGEGLQAQ